MSIRRSCANAAVMVLLLAGTACGAEGGIGNVSLYYFYGRNCHICKGLMPVIEAIRGNHSEVSVHMLEVQYNETNNQLLKSMGQAYGKKIDFVPVVFLGDRIIEGYVAGYTEGMLEENIAYCASVGCADPADKIPTTTIEENTNASSTTIAQAASNMSESTSTSIRETPANNTNPIICPIFQPCGNSTTTTNPTTTMKPKAASREGGVAWTGWVLIGLGIIVLGAIAVRFLR